MKQYKDLVKHVWFNGRQKKDRTGVGTRSVHGHQMRFDLRDGFPLVTLKFTPFKAVVAELAWFLQGNCSAEKLREMGSTIWDEWQDSNGELGPIYGSMWRSWPVKNVLDESIRVVNHRTDTVSKLTEDTYVRSERETEKCYGGHYNAEEAALFPAYFTLWKNTLINHGLERVAPEWYSFHAFRLDITAIPNFYQWKLNPGKYRLHYRYDHVLHTDEVRPLYRDTVYFRDNVVHKNGITMRYSSSGADGWYEERVEYIDQIANLIHDLKTNPMSRRHIISGWNPELLPDPSLSHEENIDMGKQALPPCHTLFQFFCHELTDEERVKYNTDAKYQLDCQLYQRSADVGLGVPFNIASYSLLTMLLAKECGMLAGEFIHTLGDAHIYNNHEDLLQILDREELPLPKLVISDEFKSILDFDPSYVSLSGYNSHARISLPVAV